jgi:hypothetical protein
MLQGRSWPYVRMLVTVETTEQICVKFGIRVYSKRCEVNLTLDRIDGI